MLIIPFTVILGWMMGVPMDLNFNEFETGAYVLTVLLAVLTIHDGMANYLKVRAFVRACVSTARPGVWSWWVGPATLDVAPRPLLSRFRPPLIATRSP